MSSIEIDGTFDIEVNNRWATETMIQFTLFGCVVHTEHYPKYLEGDGKLETAIGDAKRRFAGKLRDSLKQLETV